MFRQLATAVSLFLTVPISTVGSASPLPDDKDVGTWVLLPLKRIGIDGNFGVATVQVDVRARKLCYAIDLSDPSVATEIRLSKGSDSGIGTSVIQLRKNLRSGAWDNCVELQPDVASAILANPLEHYIDVRGYTSGSKLRARLEGTGKTLDR